MFKHNLIFLNQLNLPMFKTTNENYQLITLRRDWKCNKF